MSLIEDVLNFWFADAHQDQASLRACSKVWFGKKTDFDDQVRTQFVEVYQQAVAGDLDNWRQSAQGCLALILLFDQFPRNMFRGSAQAFATDSQALGLAKHALAQGFDRELLPVERWFLYLPFEHSESLSEQQRSVELQRPLEEQVQGLNILRYALRHLEVIERFGRFPHRNRILGRSTTAEEAEFLKQPGSSF
ncbi:DUF924 family protein [Leptolyngbya sp. FACHB-261]|uniref:DUF924 family protein n=1 Tax=Leptolyngbya sp. FACHB-261 TaxID=2692806 RepID=UPI00168A18C4|nr:DUF924 family protein [Leptolyngbya sp. FACHB-261]MBD2102297.1 DUF924 domain-containing protein [Leptolyngbya sp. FACHB-261]